MRESLRISTVAVSGLLLWEAANQAFGTREPWDSPYFWTAYLVALGLSGLFGYLFDRQAWRWGLIMIFAQWPVMFLHNRDGGPLMVVGLVMTIGLALPAIGVAVWMSGLRRRLRRESVEP